jgi:hypothetical protein
LEGKFLGDVMKGVVLTATAYGVRESTIRNFTNLGGANAYHLVASCFEDEGPGLKRLGSLWQGMCQSDLPPQTDAWPRPHRPADDAVMPHCFLVKFYPAFGLCNSSWFYRKPSSWLESGGRGKLPAINFGCLLQKMPAILDGTFTPIAIMRITAPCVNHHPLHSQHLKSTNEVSGCNAAIAMAKGGFETSKIVMMRGVGEDSSLLIPPRFFLITQFRGRFLA